MQGSFHEHRRVVGDFMRDFAFGVIFGDAIQFGFDSLGGSHGVGAGLQINTDRNGRFTVKNVHGFITAFADFHIGDVADSDGRTVGVVFNDGVAEFGCCQTTAGTLRGVVELLRGSCRHAADGTRTAFHIFVADSVFDVLNRDAHTSHSLGVKPDAHGAFGIAEDVHVSDAGQTFQIVDDIQKGVVSHFRRRERTVGRVHRHHHEHFIGALAHVNAVLANLLGQATLGRTHTVIDFEHGVVRVGADIEYALNTHFAVGSN